MEERQPVAAEAIGFTDRANAIDELELPLALQVLGAFSFRALAFVVMTAMAMGYPTLLIFVLKLPKILLWILMAALSSHYRRPTLPY